MAANAPDLCDRWSMLASVKGEHAAGAARHGAVLVLGVRKIAEMCMHACVRGGAHKHSCSLFHGTPSNASGSRYDHVAPVRTHVSLPACVQWRKRTQCMQWSSLEVIDDMIGISKHDRSATCAWCS
jgi:hypothetical protein